MFDRYTIGPRSLDVSVRHTEERAPTDESVRLLREMESAARGQVVEALRIESCGVEAVIHRYDNPMDARTHFAVHYKVNGVKRECKVSVEYRAGIEEQLEAIWKRLAEDLAACLVAGIAKGVIRK